MVYFMEVQKHFTKIDQTYEHIIKSLKDAANQELGTEEQDNSKRIDNILWNDKKPISTPHMAKCKKLRSKNKNSGQECREIESHLGGSRTSEAWKFIRNLREEHKNKPNMQLFGIGECNSHYNAELKKRAMGQL